MEKGTKNLYVLTLLISLRFADLQFEMTLKGVGSVRNLFGPNI